MKFKPFGEKYAFADDVLNMGFPDFLHGPLKHWLFETLEYSQAIVTDGLYNKSWLAKPFRDNLQIIFRESFPEDWNEVVRFIFENASRTANFLTFCLQNFAIEENADSLEYILSQSGSGYEVVKTNKSSGAYDRGVFELIERVSPVVKSESKKALEENDLLSQAWHYCYSLKPDYEKVVISCQNFLEHFLRDAYDPNNTKPQLGKIIGDLKAKPSKLSYKGETAVINREVILSLIDQVPSLRGMHTAGTGRKPTKQEAEFILHTTIYIWNLHQK